MLDPIRAQALRTVIDSLPLTERQRDLAEETIASLSPEAADTVIMAHQRLVETLPAALAAIDRIKRGRLSGHRNGSTDPAAPTPQLNEGGA
jgi:flagellar motor switch protein FliG